MKPINGSIVAFAVVCSSALGSAQQASYSDNHQPILPSKVVAAKPDSPAQQRIDAAKRQIAADPKKPQAFNNLATAYLGRARETADSNYYQDASKALAQGLRLDPDNFPLQKTQVALLLRQHSFGQAKQQAAKLNLHTPDDVMTYGYLAEAEINLGDYPEAEKNVQWMLNMRPNNVPGLLLAAQLRSVYGDPEGALDLLKLAYSESSPAEVEELAWIANRIASVQIGSGKSEASEPMLDRAEQLFPEYPYTIENRAQVRLEQNRAADAVALLARARQLDQRPQVLYQLAQAQRAAGQVTEAVATEAEFEKRAANPDSQSNETNRDLILLDSSDPGRAAMALTFAQQALNSRHDVDTLDAYAWALYANGRYQEADSAMQRALAVGIQSPEVFDHAGQIAQKLAKPEEAAKDFELAIRSDPTSEYAAAARKSLKLPATAASGLHDGSPVPSSSVAVEATAAALHLSPAASVPVASTPGVVLLPLSFSPVPQDLLTPAPTDTARQIHKAQGSVEQNQKDAQAYATLGAAYFQQARETGDVSDYELAEKSLGLSLDLVSGDFSADWPLGTLAEVCMGEHRFLEALQYSQKALALGSGDVSPFATAGDAYTDMGEYKKARAAYARLTPRDMTLSPRAAYARDSRISYLDFIAGDTAKAISLMKVAVAEGVEAQLPRENLAWLYYELGEYFTQAGNALSANAAYVSALGIHPGDYRALAGLAKLRANNGRYAEAIVLYQKAVAVVPMPIFVGELGDLYARTGNTVEAKKQYQLVEYIGLLGKINQVLHNRDLALFYADHDIKLPQALTLARKEFEVRHDVYTWDALAWALYKNGRYKEAGEADENALAQGTKDSLLLYHAGVIAAKLGDANLARTELTKALEINPHFHLIYADAARRRLASMGTQTASSVTPESHAH